MKSADNLTEFGTAGLTRIRASISVDETENTDAIDRLYKSQNGQTKFMLEGVRFEGLCNMTPYTRFAFNHSVDVRV